MKFSVIIPAHNEQAVIHRALSSIKQQSFIDYEVIVICDDCIDKTAEVAKSYGAKVFEINAHSAGAARNVGLDAAQGEWVLFCDADDWYLHEYVFEQLAEKVGRENEDAVFFALIWKNIGYGTIRSPKGTIYPHVANKCWKRSSIGTTRFPAEREVVAEDFTFFNSMMAKDLKIIEWDMPLYYYNWLRPGSKSVELGRNPKRTKDYWSDH